MERDGALLSALSSSLERFFDSNDACQFEASCPEEAANCNSNLALTLQELGDLAAAQEYLRRAIDIDEKHFEPDNPNLAIFRQTDNGLLVRMALFALILDVADRVDDSASDVSWYTGSRF